LVTQNLLFLNPMKYPTAWTLQRPYTNSLSYMSACFGMTLVWGLINAAIGYWLWWHIHVPAEAYLPHTFAHTLYWMRVNVFLDFGYGVVGILLLNRSQRVFRHKYMIAAFGNAVLLQAICLLLIDAIFCGRLYFLFQAYSQMH